MKSILFIAHISIFILAILINVKGQENVQPAMDPDSKMSSIFMHQSTGEFYIRFKDCADPKLYKLNIDEENWKYNHPKWISMEDLILFNQTSLPFQYYNIKFFLTNYYIKGRDSYLQIINNTITDSGLFYVGFDAVPHQIKKEPGLYHIPGELDIDISKEDTSYVFTIKYYDLVKTLKNEKSDLITKIIFKIGGEEFKKINCFSLDKEKERASLSFRENENTFIVKVYDCEKNQYFKDEFLSNTGYTYIEKTPLIKKRTLVFLKKMAAEELDKYVEETTNSINEAKTATVKFLGEVSRKYSDEEVAKMQANLNIRKESISKYGMFMTYTETAKDYDDKLKKIEFKDDLIPGIQIVPAENKNFLNYLFLGGIVKYNDSLLQLVNWDEYYIKGYAEGNSFFATSNFIDPKGNFFEYGRSKMNFAELIDMCPNQPVTIKKIAELNEKILLHEKSINMSLAEMNKYSFNITETKDPGGLAITEISVLKDCKKFDMNDQIERESLKALISDRNKKISETIGSLADVVGQYITISSEINSCKTMEPASSGSAVLDKIANVAEKLNKGALKLILSSVSIKAKKLLENAKKSNENLATYKKVIESYKKSS